MIERDEDSLLKKKQEQWAKEREQSQEWFPFGENLRPGGGSPLRKYYPKSPPVIIKPESPINVAKTDKNEMPKKEEEVKSEEPQEKSAPPPPPPQPYYYAYPYPYYFPPPPPQEKMEGQGMPSWPYPVPPPQYQVVPPNAIPISTINIDASQLCPMNEQLAALHSSAVWGIPNAPPGVKYGIPIPATMANQMTSSMSSSESGVSGMTSRREDVEEKQSTSDYHDEDAISRKSTGTFSLNAYEEQIAERQRQQELEIERERRELAEIEKQRAMLEERRRLEEEKRRRDELKRKEDEERRIEQYMETLEKAKREAELLRKAKVYKHVLKGAEETGQIEEIEEKILGVDLQTSKRLLNEVSELERQKKQEEQEIFKNQPTRNRSSSISMSPKSSPEKSPMLRNGYGRRSVRMTSRERAEVKVFEPKSIGQQLGNDSRQSGSGRSEETEGMYRPISRPNQLNLKNGYDDSRELDEQSKCFQRSNIVTSTPNDGLSRKNVQQNPLFGQIPTRNVRRSMRTTSSMQSPVVSSQQKMESMISVKSNVIDDGASSTGSISPDHNHNIAELPSSTENMNPDCGKMRVRSPGSSKFTQKLDQKGALKHEDDCLSPHLRRVAETNLSRSPSISSLSGSFQNLSQRRGSMMNLSTTGEASPNLSKFKSVSSSARQSLNIRIQKSTDRQAVVLDRLNKLRDSLHSGKNFNPSRASSRLNSRTSTPTAPLSPARSTVAL